MSVAELTTFIVRAEDTQAMLDARPGMIEAFRQNRRGFLSAWLVRVAEVTWHDFVEWIDGRRGTDLAEGHEELLERARSTRGRTGIEMPPVDVNQTLADHYEVDRDFLHTRTMLWDMEVRKATAPDKYILTVVRPNSAEKPMAGRYVRVPGSPSFTSRTLLPGPKSAR
jgi:hypothetical protein